MNDETRLRRGAIKSEVLNKVSIRKLFMLVSFSIFSLLFSTSNCPSFLKPYNFYIFTFPIRLITHTIDKSCIFLLCNGILVFLAKTSGLIKGSTFRAPKNNKEIMIVAHPSPADQQPPLLPAYNIKLDDYTLEEKQQEETTSMADTDEQEELEIGGESIKETQVEHKGAGSDDELYKEADDDDDDDNNDVWNTPMSTDELNKKFDEFIRKMKEEIKVEDQQKLVVVK